MRTERGSGSGTRRMAKQFCIRVDDDLFAAAQADADANGRTVAQTARFHLSRALLLAPEVKS